jgi:hypothetical protein
VEKWSRLALVGGFALCSLAAGAASFGKGLFGLAPSLIGPVEPGEAKEVAAEFAELPERPITMYIFPRSDPLEVTRLGLWVQDKRPALRLKGSCVGSCARALLTSGAPLQIESGTVIAFGGMGGLGAALKDQLDAGDLFNDDERSQASRARFLLKFKPLIEQSVASRELQAQLTPLPETARAFLDAVAGGWRIVDVSFSDDDFRFGLKSGNHRCLWWLPDAEGLRRLGLDVSGYQPSSRADAAKLLKVSEQFIYAGPLLETLPDKPLCNGAQGNINLPMRP